MAQSTCKAIGNQILFESRTYKLHGTTPILGSLPASKSIYTEFIASKAPAPECDEGIAENLHEREDKGVTVFARNSQDQICILSRHLKGFFKESLGALKAQRDIGSYKSKVDTMLFVEPMFIQLKKNGNPILEEDEMFERRLRAETPMGPRNALQSSEMLYDPWTIEFEITLFPNVGSAKKDNLSWDAVEAAMEYGKFHGIGQWRNADYGKFTWERVDDNDD